MKNLEGMIHMSDKELRDKALQLVSLGIKQLLELGYGDRIVREAVKTILYKELNKNEAV